MKHIDMGVSKNNGTPKSSILIGFSIIINHPFWGTTIFGNIHIKGVYIYIYAHIPDAPFMVYLPTCTINLSQMHVNIIIHGAFGGTRGVSVCVSVPEDGRS